MQGDPSIPHLPMQPPEPLPYLADKSALRRQLRARRNAITQGQRRRAGQGLVRLALRHRLLVAAKRIGFYMPANGEIDILPLLQRAYAMGVHCYLPIVPMRRQRKLWFSPLSGQVHSPRHWRLNRFGIHEYHHPGTRQVRIATLQRVFVPMLGFDRKGYRMGMGGGFYDASLAYRAKRNIWRPPDLVGVAYAAQEVSEMPRDPWDIPLDGLLTERQLIRPRRSNQA